jgi:hypothetical protein
MIRIILEQLEIFVGEFTHGFREFAIMTPEPR